MRNFFGVLVLTVALGACGTSNYKEVHHYTDETGADRTYTIEKEADGAFADAIRGGYGSRSYDDGSCFIVCITGGWIGFNGNKYRNNWNSGHTGYPYSSHGGNSSNFGGNHVMPGGGTRKGPVHHEHNWTTQQPGDQNPCGWGMC